MINMRILRTKWMDFLDKKVNKANDQSERTFFLFKTCSVILQSQYTPAFILFLCLTNYFSIILLIFFLSLMICIINFCYFLLSLFITFINSNNAISLFVDFVFISLVILFHSLNDQIEDEIFLHTGFAAEVIWC